MNPENNIIKYREKHHCICCKHYSPCFKKKPTALYRECSYPNYDNLVDIFLDKKDPRNPQINGGICPGYKAYSDKEIEMLWEQLEDILFDEKDNRLYLSRNWKMFAKGTEREEIWHWFDINYSKGVYKLL